MSIAHCNDLIDGAMLDGFLIGAGVMFAIGIFIAACLWLDRRATRTGRPA